MTALRNLADRFYELRIPSTILSRSTIWVWGCYAIVQGLGICWGGIDRWSGAAFTTIRHLPGSPYSWGIPLAVAGAVIIFGSLRRSNRIRNVGLIGASVWSVCFASGALSATLRANASTTGPPVYFVCMLAMCILVFVDERPPHATLRR